LAPDRPVCRFHCLTETPTPGTRERLIAGAPKRVLHQHFPGGKTKLAVAAVDDVVARLLHRLDKLLASETDPIEARRHWMAGATMRHMRPASSRAVPWPRWR